MREARLHTIAGIICTLLCACLGCDRLNHPSILGPTDKPDFKAMKWQEVKVRYSVLVKGKSRRIPRTFTISDADVLSKLHNLLLINEVSPNNTGAGDQIRITMADGHIWRGGVTFEDQIRLCKSEDNYYSYILTLSDYRFYDALRQLCLEHEKTITPTARIENIILRGNLHDSAYEVLPSSDEAVTPVEN